MNDYLVTIGMEVHAELKTASKMWCKCANVPLERDINKNICHVCLAEPGALPVPNKDAVKKVITVGLAVGAKIADFTEFDRKNYFYPDIPKGYQISQYKYPIVSGGEIYGVPLTRIHLEEDTAKSDHEKSGSTLVDFNRAGVPLMELVTDPVTYNSPQEAATKSAEFGKELQRILRTLDVSDANMEMGQMRLEANISITKDRNKFGTKCEVKNLNSFASVEKAILYECERHAEMIANNETIIQETRGWNEIKLETFSQRKKENAHDYRYFPDPDLPKMYLHKDFDLEAIQKTIPVLPAKKREQLAKLGLQGKQVDMFIDDHKLFTYFQEASKNLNDAEQKILSNLILTDALGNIARDNSLILPSSTNFSTIAKMFAAGELSSRAAKDLLLDLMKSDTDPRARAVELNLIQKNDPEAITKIVQQVIAENGAQWTEYKAGADKLLMFLVGKCMKASNGSGNPQAFQDAIKNL
jgi:aspartyl-tRNA(Asn)/glutamyl-tRNA(Gln) amidotransferase subunit B